MEQVLAAVVLTSGLWAGWRLLQVSRTAAKLHRVSVLVNRKEQLHPAKG